MQSNNMPLTRVDKKAHIIKFHGDVFGGFPPLLFSIPSLEMNMLCTET